MKEDTFDTIQEQAVKDEKRQYYKRQQRKCCKSTRIEKCNSRCNNNIP